MDPNRRRQGLKIPLIAAVIAVGVACGVYSWLSGAQGVKNNTDAADTANDAHNKELTWPLDTTIAVIVNERVAQDAEKLKLVKQILLKHQNAFIILHPSVNDLDLNININYKCLKVGKESSIFHMLKDIKPSIVYTPSELKQESMETYRIPQFIPNVIQLDI